MIRVLHITRDFPPRCHGGLSTAVGGLARASARAGHEVAVLSFDDWRPHARRPAPPPAEVAVDDGVRIMRIAAPAQLDAAAAFAARQRPRVLHVHHGMLWPFAAMLRARLSIPAVKTVHVIQRRMNEVRGIDQPTASLAGQLAALAGADRVIAPSRAAAAALLAADPALAAKLWVAPHGIDDLARPSADAPPLAAPPMGLAVGRFDDVKGTPELFAAIPRLLARVPSATFAVAGGIPASPRGEARWRRQWDETTAADVRARVQLTGWVNAATLADLYARSSALLIASRFETFGLAALEAMQHGVPVAATDAGGLAELVAHGDTGLLSPVGDVAALVDNAVALLSDPALARRLGRAGAAAVQASWRWEHRLPAIEAVYRELLTG